MEKLFVDKKIIINAAPAKVWNVLTERRYSDAWTTYFLEGMYVQSDWEEGDEVLWKDLDDKTLVKGNVTKIDHGKFLRFTVFDVNYGEFPVSEEDGITFDLKEIDGQTELHLLHGDFSVLPEGEKYYRMTIEVWDKALAKIKELSEADGK